MIKKRLYLDTSVVSHLKQLDVPERMEDTQHFWSQLIAGTYDVVLSDVTLLEIEQCSEPKRQELFDFLSKIKYTVIEVCCSEDAREIANQIIKQRVLTQKSWEDALHIAAAALSGCDTIVSWNFKHLVNVKTIASVRKVSIERGHKLVDICTPSMFI